MTIEPGVLAPFLRALGFMALFPCGYDVLGISRRLGVAVLCGVMMTECGTPMPDRLGIDEGIAELFLGALMVVPLLCLVGGAAVVGELLDAVRGESLGSLYDPSVGHTSPLAVVTRNLVWGVVMASGALVAGVDLLISSVHTFPLGAAPVFSRSGEDMLFIGSFISGHILRLAIPWVGFCLLVEVAGVLVVRLIPQLALTQELFLGKTLGLLVLFWLIDRGALIDRLETLLPHGQDFWTTLGDRPDGVFRSPVELP